MANISGNTTFLNVTTDYYDYYDDPLDEYYDYTIPMYATTDYYEDLLKYYGNLSSIMHAVTCIIISIGLPLLLMVIYALYSLVKNGQVAPIYIINLFISDLIQFCCMIVEGSGPEGEMIENIVTCIYDCGLSTSVGFMLCISLERYLVIAHPLWYRFRRTIRISVAVCVVVWIIPAILIFTVVPWVSLVVTDVISSIFFITPLPLFIFFLVGTLRALSTSVSVPSDEKRRIVAILVLVLLIYTLLFLPHIIVLTAGTYIHDFTVIVLSDMFLRLSPLADLLLFVFIKKETFGKLWSSVHCCRKENHDTNNTNTISLDHI
ncbi:G-protein coupled receptor 4-like [Cheilinus undulatus]|uniref:G-protein coupled receptor 4-like n=1 Tax=Cheilinus undulatus TaxID=241271 RepID=UPI001BD6DBC2|nr:G-protein coupled receptor 4-like [Cheilinus undulatus]